MGFEFSETMAGTVEWDAEPGTRHPFRFDVTAHAESTRAHLADGRASLRGTVYAPPMTRAAPAEGTITIRPIGQRIIRYELGSPGDDGQALRAGRPEGHPFLRPFASFTDLPAEILDDAHRQVADLPDPLRPPPPLVAVPAQLSACLIRQGNSRLWRGDLVNTW